MAIGDAVGSVTLIVAGASLTIRPAVGKEWAIHNVFHAEDAELRVVNGSNKLLFASSSAKGSWSAYYFHLTYVQYFEVKNTNAASRLIGYDGVVMKE